MRDDSDPLVHDSATLAFYEREAPVYSASGKGGVSRWLENFLVILPAGARILELGCGGGRDAEEMLQQGFSVHPTDGSAALAAKAEERLGCPVTVMRFDELAEVQAYGAVWANASLLHVPREALSDVLRRVCAALIPGGLHFANFKMGNGAARDSLGRYFNYPDRSFLGQAYGAAGAWDTISMTEYMGGGYEGGVGPWIAVTARKAPLA